MQELADLYGQAATLGVTPREVDELELWEVAAVLGLAREDAKPDLRDPARGRNIIRERVEAAMAGKAPPAAEPPPGTDRRSLPSGSHMTEGRTRGRH